MSKVKVNDIEMYYEIHGEGFPLILIIGLGGSSEIIPEEMKKEFSKHFRLILFDNRGAGRTDQPDMECSIRMMADDLAGLMDALGIEKAYIMGTSMGGMIAQEFAITYPEKVEKLILNCTHCGGSNAVRDKKDIQEFREKMENALNDENWKGFDVEYFWKLVYTEKFIEKNRDALIKSEMSKKYPTSPITYKRQYRAISNWTSYDRLPEITAPTLVQTGEKDIWIPAENSRILANRIPNAQLKIYKNVGHGFIEEKGKECFDTLLKFLK